MISKFVQTKRDFEASIKVLEPTVTVGADGLDAKDLATQSERITATMHAMDTIGVALEKTEWLKLTKAGTDYATELTASLATSVDTA